MAKNRTIKPILVFFLFFSISVDSVVVASEIVVNKSVPLTEYSLHKVRSIFTMRQRFWQNGEKIKVFTLVDDHPLHRSFSKQNLQMFPHQLRRIWDRVMFSGTGVAPVELNSEDEMIEKIANTPNAIGYISNNPDNENIRLF